MDDKMAENLDELKKEYSQCQSEDMRKYTLIEKLLARVAQLDDKLAKAKVELEREQDLEALYSQRAKEAESKLRDIEERVASNAFVSVLIDGDCMLFQDELVKQGASGGREAAHLLKHAADDYVKSKVLEHGPKAKLLVRVYANITKLSKTYVDVGILPETSSLESFIRGFNMADPLCDYIDAGTGKECSDEKLKEHFKMHIVDIQCQHIVFGGSADNGYARLLGPYSMLASHSKRITMLEGPPFARELQELVARLLTTSFDTIFRKTKVSSRKLPCVNTPPATPPSHYVAAVSQGLPQEVPSPVSSPVASSQPAVETNASQIPRNSMGQRVDVQLQYSQSDVDMLKARKLCNSYHIHGKCKYLEKYLNCTHVHGPKLGNKQLKALRFVARLTPCRAGLECKDVSCIAGHQCPHKLCAGVNCRFPKKMHGVSRIVV